MKKATNFVIAFVVSQLIFILPACNSVVTNKDIDLVEKLVYFSDKNGSDLPYISSLSDGKNEALNINLPENVQLGKIIFTNATEQWVFTGITNQSADIYTSSKDGKSVRNITNTPEYYEDDPHVSSDGKLVAYTVSQGGLNTSVVVNSIDGSKEVRLSTTPIMENSPFWLKDNKHLLILSSQEGTPNIYKVTLGEERFLNLSKGIGLDTDFSVDVKNEFLVFVSDRSGLANLFLYDFKSGQINQLTQDLGYCSSPRISSDGQKVIFRSNTDSGTDLYLINLSDRSVQRLTDTPDLVEIDLNWSFDNNHYSFTAEINGQLDIFIGKLDGDIQNLTNSPANEHGAMFIQIKP